MQVITSSLFKSSQYGILQQKLNQLNVQPNYLIKQNQIKLICLFKRIFLQTRTYELFPQYFCTKYLNLAAFIKYYKILQNKQIIQLVYYQYDGQSIIIKIKSAMNIIKQCVSSSFFTSHKLMNMCKWYNRQVKCCENLCYNSLLHFCSSKNDSSDSSKEDNQNISKPTVIQISKQQYSRMKEFLQNIKLSMPLPDYRPSMTGANTKPLDQMDIKQVNAQKKQPQKDNVLTDYFDTPDQKLSFKLLKLNSPTQFLDVMQEYKSTNDLKTKLIILHRYCSTGGNIDKYGSPTSKMGYMYMDELLQNMKRLQQFEMKQFLQLYIGIKNKYLDSKRQEQIGLNRNHKIQINNQLKLPRLQLQKLDDSSLPLVDKPSRKSAQIVILLLQLFMQNNQFIKKLSEIEKQNLHKILKHYQLSINSPSQQQTQMLDNKGDTFLQNKQTIRDLAYISIKAGAYGMHEYSTVELLLQKLNQLKQKEEIDKNGSQIIIACQILIQCSSYFQLIDYSQFMSFVQKLRCAFETKIALLESKQYRIRNDDYQDQQAILNQHEQTSSLSLFSLLHKTLLALQQNYSRSSAINFLSPLLSVILKSLNNKSTIKHIQNAEQNDNKVAVNDNSQICITAVQYCQMWQSCMLMYKLQKLKLKSVQISQDVLYTFVNNYLYKCNIKQWIHQGLQTNDDTKIVEQAIVEKQRVAFQCLVGYRMILTYQMHTKQVINAKYANILQQISQDSKNYLSILKNLLLSYNIIMQTVCKTGIISSPESYFVHNFIIALMISESYPLQAKESSEMIKNNTYANMLINPITVQMLKQFGMNNKKYGAYVKKLINKFELL